MRRNQERRDGPNSVGNLPCTTCLWGDRNRTAIFYNRSILKLVVSMSSSSSFLYLAPTFPVDTGYGDFRFTPLSHSSITISVGSQMPHTHSKSATQHKIREPGFVPCAMSVRRLAHSFRPFHLSFSFDNETHQHCSSCAAFRSFKCFTYAPVSKRIAAAGLPGSLFCHHGSCGRCVATTRT